MKTEILDAIFNDLEPVSQARSVVGTVEMTYSDKEVRFEIYKKAGVEDKFEVAAFKSNDTHWEKLARFPSAYGNTEESALKQAIGWLRDGHHTSL